MFALTANDPQLFVHVETSQLVMVDDSRKSNCKIIIEEGGGSVNQDLLINSDSNTPLVIG